MDRLPFVAHIKVVPDRVNGTRREIIRSRDKISYWIYQDLVAHSTGTGTDALITLAEPGSGVSVDIDNAGTASLLAYGGATTPQFGENPDLVTIVGFVTIDASLLGTFDYNPLDPPYGEISIIHSSVSHNASPSARTITGPAGAIEGWKTNGPTAENRAAATALKDLINSAIGSNGTVYWLELQGIRYGVGGFHFDN